MTSRTRAPRVAIAGTGMIGEVHHRSARAGGAEVVGVLGSTPQRGVQAARRWGVEEAFTSIDELLHADVDVLHVCSPNDTHARYALEAMRRGVHVICEKPLAITSSDAAEMLRAAEVAGVVATVPFVYRFHPLVRELRARREGGEFGRIHLIHGSYLQDWLVDPLASSWRVDRSVGGPSRAFADIGSHWCDLVEFISGERVVAVQASTSVVYPERPTGGGDSFGGRSGSGSTAAVATEDVAVATFTTASGILVNTVISQVSAGRKNRLWLEIDGSLASAVFDQENPNSVWIGREGESGLLERGAGGSPQQSRLNRVPPGHPQGYPDAFAAFVADTYSAVAGDVPDGLPTFADGLRSVFITEAVLASRQAGTAVSVGAASPLPTTS